MLRIRLRRMGARHRPFYRIVVSDSRNTPTGRFNEILGTYDPSHDPADLKIDLEKAEKWLGKGAHASETVARLIDRARREGAAETA